MTDKYEGIILSSSDYKEADSLISVLLKDKGLVSFVVKGSKKMTSKLAANTMPFCLSEFIFEYKERKTIFSLRGSTLIKNYYDDLDLNKLSAYQVIADIAKRCYDEDDYDNYLYEETLMAFEKIQAGDNLFIVLAYYMVSMSRLTGISPQVDGCAICGESKVVSISNRDGGFLCLKHALNLPKYDVLTLKKFRFINKMNWDYIDNLNAIGFDLNDLEIVADFFFEHSDFKLKSYKFFISLFNDN